MAAVNHDDLVELIENQDTSADDVWDWYEEHGKQDVDFRLVYSKATSIEKAKSDFSTNERTGLHYAAFFGRVQIVERLLDKGADPSIKGGTDDSENALSAALDSPSGDVIVKQVAELLLDETKYEQVRNKRTDILECQCGGFTPLLAAINSNFETTAEFLLDKGADPLVESTRANVHSLCLAAQVEGGILKMLLDHPKIKDSTTEKCRPELINHQYGYWYPLHHATMYLHSKHVELLVDQGAEVKVEDAYGNFPIHYITEATSPEQFKAMAVKLKDSVNERDYSDGLTVLHRAALLNKIEFVKILTEEVHGIRADYNIEDDMGRLPIHYLSQHRGNEHLVYHLTDKHSFKAPDKEGWTPLHFAVKESDYHLVRVLLNAKARTLYPYKHCVEGRTGIHLAVLVGKGNDTDFRNVLLAFKNNMDKDSFKSLVDQNVGDGNEKNKGKTALHLAIQEKKFSRARILLDEDFDADPAITDREGKNSLHYAFEHGAPTSLFEKIKDKYKVEGSDRLPMWEELQEVRDDARKIPLQYLNKETKLDAVRLMTKVNLTYRGVADSSDMKSPLVIATEKKMNEVVKLLLVKDAVVETRTLRDAIIKDNVELVQILVRHADKDNLVGVLNEVFPTPNYGEGQPGQPGPGQQAPAGQQGQQPGAGQQAPAGQQGQQAPPGQQAPAGQQGQQPAAQGEDETDSGLPTVSFAYRHSKNHKRRQGPTTVFRELIDRMPDVAKEALYRCVEVNHKRGSESVKFDYCFIHPPSVHEVASTSDEKGHVMPMRRGTADEDIALTDPLNMMVEAKQTDLLQHPLVGSYLHLKWNALGFGYYIINFIMYFIYLMSLSIFSVTVNNPRGMVCNSSEQVNVSDQNTTEICGSYWDLIASYTFAIIVVNLAFYHLLVELFRFYFTGWRYVIDLQNYIELVLYIMSVIFVFIFFFDCGCPQEWQWQIGIMVVFLGWINLVFYASNFPLTALYVIMFKTIVFTFLQLTLFAVLLVTAFTFILFMMFHNPVEMFGLAAFQGFWYSLFTTINFIEGGIPFESLFGLDSTTAEYRAIPYVGLNIFMWLVFLFFFPIVFKNLLIGLAIADVNEIYGEAEIKKLELQVRVFDKAELVLPTYVAKEFLRDISKTKTITFKKKNFFKRARDKVSLVVWGGKNYLEDLEDDAYERKRQEERAEIRDGDGDGKELSEIKERMEEMSNMLQTLMATINSRD